MACLYSTDDTRDVAFTESLLSLVAGSKVVVYDVQGLSAASVKRVMAGRTMRS